MWSDHWLKVFLDEKKVIININTHWHEEAESLCWLLHGHNWLLVDYYSGLIVSTMVDLRLTFVQFGVLIFPVFEFMLAIAVFRRMSQPVLWWTSIWHSALAIVFYCFWLFIPTCGPMVLLKAQSLEPRFSTGVYKLKSIEGF